MAQKIGQALKDLLAKATGQAPKDKNAQSPPGNQNTEGQNAQQSKNPSGDQQAKGSQPKSDAEAQAGGMGAPQDAGLPGEGNDPTGNKPGTQQMTQNPSLETHTTPEVVPLVSTNFKGQANVLTTSQSGKAQVPLLDTSPLADGDHQRRRAGRRAAALSFLRSTLFRSSRQGRAVSSFAEVTANAKVAS